MMTKKLLGELYPRYRSGVESWAGFAALLALVLGCAVAQAAVATKTRPAKVRRSASLQAETPRAGGRKAGRGKAAAKKPGADVPGTRHSDARAKNVLPGKPSAKGRRRSKHDDEPTIEMPTMYRVRGGRYGRRQMLTVRGRQAAIRAAAVRAAAFEAAAAASPLRGTHDVLVHQNVMASGEGLARILNDDDLDRLRASDELVDFTPSRMLQVNPALPQNRRCARVWTVQFVEDLAQDYYTRFGVPLMVTSAARSVSYQRSLERVNGNAAGIEGDTASPHLTGQAIDIGKRGMSRAQLAWMRDQLLPMMQSGEIDVEEEFRQACFHISVYRSYLPEGFAPVQRVAQTVPAETGQSQP